MVSLNNGRYHLGDGDDNIQPQMPLLPTNTHFRRMNTIWSASLALAAMVTLEVLLFVFDFNVGYSTLDDGQPFSFLCLLHVCVWLVVVAVSRFHERCHRLSRLRGYLSFYRETQLIRKAPFAVMSAGNAVLLVVATAWPSDKEDVPVHVHRLTALQIICTIEMAVCLPCGLLHIAKVLRFNRRRDVPDVHSDLLSTLHPHAAVSDELDDSNPLADVLEKQSDMIRYYKQQVLTLSRRIHSLSTQVHGYERGLPEITGQ